MMFILVSLFSLAIGASNSDLHDIDPFETWVDPPLRSGMPGTITDIYENVICSFDEKLNKYIFEIFESARKNNQYIRLDFYDQNTVLSTIQDVDKKLNAVRPRTKDHWIRVKADKVKIKKGWFSGTYTLTIKKGNERKSYLLFYPRSIEIYGSAVLYAKRANATIDLNLDALDRPIKQKYLHVHHLVHVPGE